MGELHVGKRGSNLPSDEWLDSFWEPTVAGVLLDKKKHQPDFQSPVKYVFAQRIWGELPFTWVDYGLISLFLGSPQMNCNMVSHKRVPPK